MYTAMYMVPATRTQVYLTREQRAQLDALGRREGKALAELVREALDAYLARAGADPDEALRATFGSMPSLETPARNDWERG
jgi:hypothetical protein